MTLFLLSVDPKFISSFIFHSLRPIVILLFAFLIIDWYKLMLCDSYLLLLFFWLHLC